MLASVTKVEVTLLILIAILNLISFVLFYSDKKRAMKHKRRIPEKNLLLSTYLFGGIGAYLGMKIFRHKTKHRLFKLSVPIAAFLTFGLILFILIGN